MPRIGAAMLLLLLSACAGPGRCGGPAALDAEAAAARYARPLPLPPAGPFAVYHLGHSLVGRDMPAMLAQLAGPEHGYASQLGWGASLKAHWGDAEIAGFAEENAHPAFRPAREAAEGGDYDAFVLTEMVEIRDAIRYQASADYLHRWVGRIREGDPGARIYLYETWHARSDSGGTGRWLARLDEDLRRYWEGEILWRVLARDGVDPPVYLIPAGQVLAAFSRALAARGGVDGLAGPADLFTDEIHLNDVGAYLVALTHYAVLYGRSPVGLPRELARADGSPATAPGPAAARLMQEVVWRVVTALPETGVEQEHIAMEYPADE